MARPRLIAEFQDARCFTTAEAARAVGKQRASESIQYLRRAGYVRGVRRGLYAFDPKRTGDGPDRFVIASKVVTPYALCFHSALELHGVSQSASYSSVYIGAPVRRAPFTYEGISYRPVLVPAMDLRHGTAAVRRSGERVVVACRELALLQAIQRPGLCGGTEAALSAIESFPSFEWSVLERLLTANRQLALWRRVGFVIEKNVRRWNPPDALLEKLRSLRGPGTSYFGVGRNMGGRLVARWSLIVPPGMAEGGPNV